MALSTNFPIFQIKYYIKFSQFFTNIPLSVRIIPVRYLRGTRHSKDISQEEYKYQRLLRSFKFDSKQDVKPDHPIEEANASIQENISQQNDIYSPNTQSTSLITAENLIKKLEEKFFPLQGKPYVRQLEKKYNKTCGILKVLGRKLHSLNIPITMGPDKLPCPVEYAVKSPLTEGYRNKDEFSVGMGLDGNEKVVGFLLDTPSEYSTTLCISPKELSFVRENHKKFAEDFQNYIRKSHLPATQHFSDRGYWKNLIVHSNSAGDVMGIVVIHPQDLSQEDIEAEKIKLKTYFSSLLKSSYNLHSLYFQTCVHSRCTHEQSPFELIFGKPSLIEEINNLKIHISPDSYFLTNTKAAESMYNALLKICRVKNTTTVFDICCGNGSLSMVFSSRVKKCIGIDDSIQAINDAKMNAKENNMHNVEFIYGKTEMITQEVLKREYYEDLLAVLNISRAGISKSLVTSLRECKSLKKIIYMTTKSQNDLENFVALCRHCGPARNLGQAFVPILALPVDLYPNSDSFGLIVMFQRL